jgi:3-hydroxy-9,10-secoandrosta-1,3,5(10)-triene-9,17-dione monooxygenase reductase component
VTVHSENPFSVPVDRRDPVRRLRGRLAAPVTIITAAGDPPSGLTVSSFFVVEGEVPRAAALMGAGADVLEAAEESGAFVAHILNQDGRGLADIFAGLRPSPGGVFAATETEETRWGPRLTGVTDWAGCRLEEIRPLGDQHVMVGVIEDLEVSDLSNPLLYFRGEYRRLER